MQKVNAKNSWPGVTLGKTQMKQTFRILMGLTVTWARGLFEFENNLKLRRRRFKLELRARILQTGLLRSESDRRECCLMHVSFQMGSRPKLNFTATGIDNMSRAETNWSFLLTPFYRL